MKNPTKYVKQAIESALTAINMPFWYKYVPKDAVEPNQYVILSSTSKQMFAEAKCGFEWLVQVNLNINQVFNLGFPPNTTLDDAEEKVMNAIRSLSMPLGSAFDIKTNRLINQVDMTAQTGTKSYEQRVLTYEFWVNFVEKN